ncbi:mono/diheme cytochrome c family protein [Saonia flava]|uniref:Mono/diheme cytochrome c family protein n=1 Tax=Saonia flava TaxID=523696 RepID=A0A846QW82_9FLAO|nr:cytochrome c [Saonia flava]NJB72248.1 mono/diheme cytochrome c family protein [Saonia flava]
MKQFLLGYILVIGIIANFLFQDKDLEESMVRGSEIYADFCVTCHLDTGKGVEGVFPPLANSDYLMENREKSIFGIKYGQTGDMVVNGVTYSNTMVSPGLEDEEIADVMNYILNTWGNKSDKIVTTEEVTAIKK